MCDDTARRALFFSEGLEVLRDTCALLWVVRWVFDPRVPSCRHVTNHWRPGHLCCPLSGGCVGIGVAVAILVVSCVSTVSSANGQVIGPVGSSSSAVLRRCVRRSAVHVDLVVGDRRAHGAEYFAIWCRRAPIAHQRFPRPRVRNASSSRRSGIRVSAATTRHGGGSLPPS
jgi:hypothetical protein